MTQKDKKLTRSTSEKVVAGVLGGVAEYFGWDVTVVRLLFSLITIFSAAFPGVMVYVILWIVMPVNETSQYQQDQ